MTSHIYIAGPMRGYDGYNFPAFFEAEEILKRAYPDAVVMNPAREDLRKRDREFLLQTRSPLDMGRELEENFTGSDLREALAYDLSWVTSACTLLVVLPGWDKSKGARAEVAAANAIGIEVVEIAEVEIFDDPGVEQADGEDPAVAEWHTTCGPLCPIDGSQAAEGPSLPREKGETRMTSASGGQKGVKLAQFDQIPPETLIRLAEHFGRGAAKYSAHNFRRGYPWSYSYNALMRHLTAFWRGEEYDRCPEDDEWGLCKHEPDTAYEPGTCFNHTGSHHLDAVMWHSHVLRIFFDEHKEYDDRYGSQRPTA